MFTLLWQVTLRFFYLKDQIKCTHKIYISWKKILHILLYQLFPSFIIPLNISQMQLHYVYVLCFTK